MCVPSQQFINANLRNNKLQEIQEQIIMRADKNTRLVIQIVGKSDDLRPVQ